MPAKKQSTVKKAASAPTGGLLIPEKIAPLVHLLRLEKVILDTDLAELNGVTTGNLNKTVQRNIDRFPSDFMFQVNEDEIGILRSQIVTSKNAGSALLFQSGIAKNSEPPLRSQLETLKDNRPTLARMNTPITNRP